MAIKKLSEHMQTIFCYSKITDYKTAVEEMVYNSLDGKSTSIAVRLHIQENKIQVIDNGCGMAKQDFRLLGQKYATSKYTNLEQFKAAPNTYGFHGLALSNIVDVSRNVKIISRSENSEDTWCKTFHAGKEKDLIKTTTRPSKGTTIEIDGFLYNLNIQNKATNAFQELNDIKTFLEQISLVHSNVSLTLRDNRTNEIVFQMHKNRDIYQKIKLLFNIEKADIQELQVEKNEYKSLAYISKKCNELTTCNWIFLNLRIVRNCKLIKIVEQYFIKYLKLSTNKCNKISENENNTTKTYLPFYIIFLSCPYYDYDVSLTPKQSVLEFKNWQQIRILLEKLIKFYKGDLNLKEINVQEKPNYIQQSDIKEQIQKITKRILGSNSKIIRVSQMQNGIKGKLIKRKKKIANQVPSTKFMSSAKPRTRSNILCSDKMTIPKNVKNITNKLKSKQTNKLNCTMLFRNKINNTFKNIHGNYNETNNYNIDYNCKIIDDHSTFSISADEINPRKRTNKEIKDGPINVKKAIKQKGDLLLSIFENPPETVKKRCDILAKEAESAIYDKKIQQTVIVNESVNFSNFTKDNKNISIKRKFEEIIIHNVIPLHSDNKKHQFKEHCNKSFASSHDLLKTIITQQENNIYQKMKKKEIDRKYYTIKDPEEISQSTYQSHKYKNIRDKFQNHCIDRNKLCNQSVTNNSLCSNNVLKKHNKKHKTHFISKYSKDNFIIPDSNTSFLAQRKSKFMFSPKNKYHVKDAYNIQEKLNEINISASSKNTNVKNFKILENTSINQKTMNGVEKCKDPNEHSNSLNHGFTYTITSSNVILNDDDRIFENRVFRTIGIDENMNREFPVVINKNVDTNNMKEPQKNIIFEPMSQNADDSKKSNNIIEPINVCDVIINTFGSVNHSDIQFEHNFNNNSHYKFCSPTESIKNQNMIIRGKDVNDSNVSIFCEYNCAPTNNISNESNRNYNIENGQTCNKIPLNNNDSNCITESNYFINKDNEKHEMFPNPTTFKLKNRSSFLPKGMSPIYENCNSKSVCDYNLENEYYHNALYFNFNNDVHSNAELYEAQVLNTENVTTKNIEKLNIHLEKSKSSLTFSSKSLKDAKVMGQVDDKFIAAILTGESDSGNYFILFDQHAVHERIRVEKLLSNYFNGNAWNSVDLDDVSLKLTKDEVMYLHNYKEKFSQFGLQWTIANDNEIKLHAIPFAILGQIPREVEKIIHAAKNLITEEIINIKSQKGCISLYPKSIMNLVNNEFPVIKLPSFEIYTYYKTKSLCIVCTLGPFKLHNGYPCFFHKCTDSRACRYSIMFGDTLSKKECVELITSLSACKTPFQCAHGRPVMAVIMKFKRQSHVCEYQINMETILRFKGKYIPKNK